MSGQRQSIELVLAKGSNHLTKKIEERKSSEVKPITDDISPPLYLSTKKKKNRNRSLTGSLISDLARAILLSKLSEYILKL